MRGPIGLSLLFAALAGVAPHLNAQAASALEIPQIRASGTARRGVRPELATLTLSFTAAGPTPGAAGRAVALRADSLRRALSAAGIPHDSLLTGSRWYWWRGRIEQTVAQRQVPRQPTATPGPTMVWITDTTYRASDAIEVHVRDLTRVGAVIDSALAHGITEITPVRFSAAASPALQDELTREATAGALRQAETLAAASHTRLGRLLSLSTQPENRYDYAPYVLSEQAGTGGSDAGSTTVVQPSITITVSVYGRWEILR